jgi:hypothetical protein
MDPNPIFELILNVLNFFKNVPNPESKGLKISNLHLENIQLRNLWSWVV